MKKFLIVLFFIAFISGTNAQTFTITQVDTFAIQGLPDQPVLKVVINTGESSSLSLERLVVYSTSEDSLDIDKVRIYRTTGNRFSYAEYQTEIEEVTSYGVNFLKDSAVFSGLTFPLNTGDNILWITYNLSKNSKAGHFIDGYIKAGGIKISGITYPSETANPSGELLIRQKYFTENFEKFGDNRKPLNWTISGDINADWKCELGGYDGNPSTFKSGNLNARSYAENPSGRVSRMISKPLNLSLSIKPKLTFYHAQVFRPVTDKSDSLGIYYGFTSTGPWNFIKNYTLPTPDGLWIKREIDLPDEMVNSNVYLVFKSTAQWGFGVCVDSITIYEANESERKIKSIICNHPTTYFIPQGSSNKPVLRVNIGVTGNTGSLTFSSITVNSLNTSDNDISNVKLFSTTDSVFISPTLMGTGTYSSGKLTFSGFTRRLESGDNYFWITYDVKDNAIPDNLLDAKITPGDLVISDGATYPSAELSPSGSRIIKQSIFFDDFESNKGWSLSGEFERGIPQGKGGVAFGFKDPALAYSMSNILGTDLGLAGNNGDYNKSTRDLAVSPLIQGRYFKNTLFSFARWLNSENQDSAVIEYMYEGETKWKVLWETPSTIIDGSWSVFSTSTKNIFDRKNFRLRFRLGTTNVLEEYSGWNIDDLFLTGDSIKYDAALTEFLGPFSACGLTSGEQVQVKVKNTGPKTLSNIPIKLSIDGGKTWISETIPGNLNVDNSTTHAFQPVNLSKPAKYKIIVKVTYPGDNYTDNDSVVYDLTSVPTFTPPFTDGFEKDTSFWLVGGINPSWVNGKPSGVGFSTAYEGEKCWKTDLYSGYHSLFENSYIESPCFNLSNAEIPLVDLFYRYNTESSKSGARFEYSLDGGASYQYVPKDNYTFPWSWYNGLITTFHDNTSGWTGETKDGAEFIWVNGKQALPSSLANKNLVRFRLHFKVDSTLENKYPGFAFDNFRILNSPHDAGVISIDDLSSPACQYANSDKLKVTVKNFGLRKIRQNDSIIVAIKVNNNPVVKDTFKLATDLNVNDTRQFTMKRSVNFGDPGDYKIKAYIIDQKPGYYGTNNDTANLDITVYTNPITNLPDTIFTARADTLTVKAHYDADYNYEWIYGGSIISTTYQVDAITTGFGSHSLTVDNKISGCITRDTVFIKRLIPDLGVVEIVSPTNNCGYKTPTRPVVKIQNFGTDTIRGNQLIPVKVRLNKNSDITENVALNQKLAPGDIMEITLTSTLNLLTPKTDTLKIWTQLTGDDDITNDTTTSIFQILGYPHIFLGNDTTIKGKLTYELNAGTGHKTILWNDGVTTTEKYTISWPGKYWVTVTDNNDCASTDTIKVHMVIHDLKMSTLVSPINACTQTATTSVQCRIKNAGTDTIQTSEPITLYYEFNNGAKIEEVLNLSNELRPNDSILYTFPQTVDMSAKGTYNFKIKSILAGDIQPLNDSITKIVKVFGNPVPDIGKTRIVQALTLTLYPGKFASYKWQDNSTDSVWVITKTHYQKPNNTYTVSVTDTNGCSAQTTASIFLLINDLQISEVVLPPSSCSLSDKEIINVKVTNVGNAPLENKDVKIFYSLNGGPEVEEKLFYTGALDATVVHTFATPINMSPKGDYKFKFRLSLAEDINPSNDTLTHLTKVLGFPVVDFKAANDTIVTKLPYTLHAGPGYAEYQWQDMSTDSVFTITKDNYVPSNPIYSVYVTNIEGCSVSKDVKVIEAFYDLGITGINTPLSNCTLPAGKLRVKIKNNSSVAISNKSATLGYTLNGGTQVNKTVNVSLSKGATQEVEFDGDINMSAIATHNLNVSLTFADDEDVANNTASYEVKVLGNPTFQLATDTLRTNVIPATLDAGAGFASYKWSNNATDQTISVSSNGWYKVVVTDNNSCTAKDSIYFINTTGTGWLKDHAEISLHPNPAVNYLHISIGLEKKETLMLDMISQTGKVVFSKKLENIVEFTDEVDVSILPKGLYYVRLYSKDSMIVEKIMIR